jgi:hypothetical protein
VVPAPHLPLMCCAVLCCGGRRHLDKFFRSPAPPWLFSFSVGRRRAVFSASVSVSVSLRAACFACATHRPAATPPATAQPLHCTHGRSKQKESTIICAAHTMALNLNCPPPLRSAGHVHSWSSFLFLSTQGILSSAGN